MPRGTPLYGQPAWWGDDEADEKSGCKQDSKQEEKTQESGASGKSVFLFLWVFLLFIKVNMFLTRELNKY